MKDSGIPCKVEFQRSDIMYHDSGACYHEVETNLNKLCGAIECMIADQKAGQARPTREGIYNGSCYGCQFNENVCPCEWDVVNSRPHDR